MPELYKPFIAMHVIQKDFWKLCNKSSMKLGKSRMRLASCGWPPRLWGSLQVTAVAVFLPVTVQRRHDWHVMQESWMLIAVSHVVWYCVKRSVSEKQALLPTNRNFCECCLYKGHFLYSVERVKRFVIIHLHCIVAKCKRWLPGKISADAHGEK